jgi:mRNA interferase HicA
VKGAEFKRKVQKLANCQDVPCTWNPAIGKGSHGRITFGDKSTTLKDLKKEIGRVCWPRWLKQLGIDPNEL